jgi:CDP-glycerol glycerophosphotransferase (TagB/SpsB family)
MKVPNEISDQKSKAIHQIGFVVQTPELFNHFRTVWNLLDRNTIILVIPDGVQSKSEIVEQAQKEELAYVFVSELLETNRKLKYLVSNHFIESIGDKFLIERIGTFNIRFMYATGKAGWNFRPWNQIYDVILCYGPYHQRNLEFCKDTLVMQMGYPRMDRFFNERIDREPLMKRFDCRPEKQTIVWLPTWKEFSSIEAWGDTISELRDDYNVIVKLHPFMVETEPEQVKDLERLKFNCIIKHAFDNVYLYALSDYLLCDYGGPAFAGIYVDKNLLLLNVFGAEQDEYIGVGSSEFLIRKIIPNLDISEKNALRSLLRDPTVWQKQERVRKVLRKYFFAPYYGISSSVAALILKNLNNIIGK